MSLRESIYARLNPTQKLNATSYVLIVVILLAVMVAIAETEPEFVEGREGWFRSAELVFAVIFGLEYGLRIWAAAEGPVSRLRYALSPASVVDLLAVIGALLPFFGADVLILRLVRVVRMFRVAKLGRFHGHSRLWSGPFVTGQASFGSRSRWLCSF